ncbi:hypothetical protein V1525DRAFT_410556 [Lipomyces kononenkoae]|uniref:Uncharacterized protein n=1 Tax=Lipomyces kononenkoae TaxID=34357 RepID=A0ACC3SUA8_LIPKO
MKLVSLLLFVSLVLADGPTTAGPPAEYTVTCTLGGNPCPTGSMCSQTETCGGLCLTTQTFPPVIPCTMGDNAPCGSASTCTPTMFCPPSPTECLGQCIATAPSTGQPPPPSIACVVGGPSVCPQGSFCTQTMICGGLCIPTAAPSPTPTPCGGDYPPCPNGYRCARHHDRGCSPGDRRQRFCVKNDEDDQ